MYELGSLVIQGLSLSSEDLAKPVKRLKMVFGKLFSLFGKKPGKIEYDEEALAQWYEDKSAIMERVLGEEHNMVMHAIIPYDIGGGLDLYYYPHGIQGVGVGTKELCETPDSGSSNDQFGAYELVMFTRHTLNLDEAKDGDTDFGKAHATINAVLNVMAPYSAQATLNHNDTSEFPAEMETIGGKCFILQAYGWSGKPEPFGVLAVIEVFRSEMDFAREHGTPMLVEKLEASGYFPYSDLDRDPVV